MKRAVLFLQLALVVALPVAILASWRSVPIRTSPCQGVGLSGNNDWISCAGDCPQQPVAKICIVMNGNDGTAYKYCTCCKSPSIQCEAESSCCHLVARSQTLLAVRGLCTYPACDPTSGHTCQLNGTPGQPVCLTPPGE